MVKVNVYKQSNFPVASSPIKKKLAAFFTKQGIVSDAEVSVAIVGESKMLALSKKHLGDNLLHNVLSFEPGGDFLYPDDKIIHLGEIVVCFPEAVREAKEANVLISERVYDLVEHGALHLLGIHHEE